MLLTLMITTGCSSPMHFNDSHMDIYKRIHHTYSRMTSYTAEVKLTVKSNKTENTYLLTQDVKVPHMSALTIKEPSHMEGLKTVINGDKVLVRLAESEVLAYGLPWKGSSEYCLNRRIRIKAIVIPMHSSVNKITRLDTLGIVEKLMPHVFLPHWDKRCLELALSAFDTLQTEISVWLLECRPDKEAVKLTYGTVFDK